MLAITAGQIKILILGGGVKELSTRPAEFIQQKQQKKIINMYFSAVTDHGCQVVDFDVGFHMCSSPSFRLIYKGLS